MRLGFQSNEAGRIPVDSCGGQRGLKKRFVEMEAMLHGPNLGGGELDEPQEPAQVTTRGNSLRGTGGRDGRIEPSKSASIRRQGGMDRPQQIQACQTAKHGPRVIFIQDEVQFTPDALSREPVDVRARLLHKGGRLGRHPKSVALLVANGAVHASGIVQKRARMENPDNSTFQVRLAPEGIV